MEVKIGNAILRIVQGDITDQDVDAIINAANSSLMGGGGVDGAIHRRGGSEILEECKKIRATQYLNGLPTGKAVITTGGNLKARHVIHTVGPIWRGGTKCEAELLSDAYRNSLQQATENSLKMVAFPSLSTGAYGYPISDASRIAVKTVKTFLEHDNRLDEVRFVLFTQESYEAFTEALKELS
jgi:O-acetyl-ADP-ribose deacetylase (regulator of RNase III)